MVDCETHRLDLGRSSRHANEVQRLALAIRDGFCIWDGCGRSAAGCDAHHLIEWEDGGLTDLANLALLCPFHHQRLHQMGCRLKVGEAPGEWMLVQRHTNRLVDRWTNPLPSGATKSQTQYSPAAAGG
ncbi:MAG: HNH endonuclease [Acidimicrobiales bacterium]|nr:HNH endonuclease [Acidimicrobiales bacterium]